MNKSIQCGGGNTYKLPQAGKDAIIRSQKRDIPLCLLCQAMHTGGAIDRHVIKAYMEGRLAMSNQVVSVSQVMVLGQLLTALVVPALVVPAFWPLFFLPTRLGEGNRLRFNQ